MFEFNIDYLVNISFLHLFILNFYIRIFFSNITPFLNLTSKYNFFSIFIYRIILLSTISINLLKIICTLHAIEILNMISLYIFNDHALIFRNNSYRTSTLFFFKSMLDLIFFYFALFIFKSYFTFYLKLLNNVTFTFNLSNINTFCFTYFSKSFFFFNNAILIEYSNCLYSVELVLANILIIINYSISILLNTFYFFKYDYPVLYNLYILCKAINTNSDMNNNFSIFFYKSIFANLSFKYNLHFITFFINYFAFIVKDVLSVSFVQLNLLYTLFSTWSIISSYSINLQKFNTTKLNYVI